MTVTLHINSVYCVPNITRSPAVAEGPRHLSVTSNGTNGWQHLLHQYDVVIITAINLSARICLLYTSDAADE